MKIDDVIKSKFNSEYNKLAVNIMYTYGWLNNFISSKLSEYNLTQQQYNILRILRGQHPNSATIGLLKERMIDKTPDVSRLVDRMLLKGIIIRESCCVDRRKSNIKISDEGLKLLKSIDQLQKEFDEFLYSLDANEAAQLNNLLDKLRG